MSHPARVYTTLQSLLEDCLGKEINNNTNERIIKYRRSLIRRWNKWIARHGSPLIIKCEICSGRRYKNDIKQGRYKVSSSRYNDNVEE